MPEGEEKEAEKPFEKIRAKSFPNLGKKTDIQIQETQKVLNKMNRNRPIPKHIITTLSIVKYKDRILAQ